MTRIVRLPTIENLKEILKRRVVVPYVLLDKFLRTTAGILVWNVLMLILNDQSHWVKPGLQERLTA